LDDKLRQALIQRIHESEKKNLTAKKSGIGKQNKRRSQIKGKSKVKGGET
jgi:hypothetical protein